MDSKNPVMLAIRAAELDMRKQLDDLAAGVQEAFRLNAEAIGRVLGELSARVSNVELAVAKLVVEVTQTGEVTTNGGDESAGHAGLQEGSREDGEGSTSQGTAQGHRGTEG